MLKIFKKKKALIFLIIAIAGLSTVIAFALRRPPEILYRDATVTRSDIESTVISTGTVAPENRVEIRPPIEGRVEEIFIKEGQSVKKGQVLAFMSSNERASLLDSAHAEGDNEVKRWEALYQPTPIIAPINGTIILKSVEPGQTFISKNSLFVISDRLAIKAQVDETDIAQIHLNQEATITLDAYPDQKFLGEVTHIGYDVYRPTENESSAKTMNQYVTTYMVDVVPKNPPEFLRSGMTANVKFLVETKKNVPALPAEAIQTEEHRTYVLIPAKEAKAEPIKKDITTGISDNKQTEITSGISEGDHVLIPIPKLEKKEENSFIL